MTNPNPNPSKPPRAASINDNLPNSNPPLSVVLGVLGAFVLVVLVLMFHKSLGF